MLRRVFMFSSILAYGVILAIILFTTMARSQDAPSYPCPVGAPSCKILVLTPQEEQAMMAERGILDTAEQGRPLDLGGAAKYFRERIRTAPAGKAEAKP